MSILKWVGGKQDVLKDIIPIIPKNINNYYELFLGGGSVLINLLEEQEKKEPSISINKFIVNDINYGLICVYNQIKTNLEPFIQELKYCETLFLKTPEIKLQSRQKIYIPKTLNEASNRQQVFYYIRQSYNELIKNKEDNCKIATYFVFLNRTCFRGLYREGKNGYNVPYGNYKNPSILNIEKIKRLNYLFNKNKVIFNNISFEDLKIEENSFVYVDPPYYPINKTSFIDYNKSGFDKKKHEILIDLLNKLNEGNIKFLMSNSYTEWIIDKCKLYKHKKIEVKRRIHSKSPSSKIDEILVWNYNLENEDEMITSLSSLSIN